MAEGNQKVLDSSIRYAVFLERYKSGVVNRLTDVLLEADQEDVDRLARLLERLSNADKRKFALGRQPTTQAGRAFADFLREMRGRADSTLKDTLTDEITPVADLKSNRNQRIAASVGVSLTAPPSGQLRAALNSAPFEGRILREWTKDWSRARHDRMTTALRVAIGRGDSIPDMVKAIRGTRARKYADGILNVSRRSAATLARTATNHVIAQSDATFAEANAERLQWVVWTSVLDTRTSDVCRANDGRQFRPGDNWQTLIPAHPNCRSVWTYIYKGQGPREDKDYYDWLRDQDRGLVVEALGETRAKLFLDGGLGRQELVRDATTGQPWTLDELRRREAEAFEAAGL